MEPWRAEETFSKNIYETLIDHKPLCHIVLYTLTNKDPSSDATEEPSVKGSLKNISFLPFYNIPSFTTKNLLWSRKVLQMLKIICGTIYTKRFFYDIVPLIFKSVYRKIHLNIYYIFVLFVSLCSFIIIFSLIFGVLVTRERQKNKWIVTECSFLGLIQIMIKVHFFQTLKCHFGVFKWYIIE